MISEHVAAVVSTGIDLAGIAVFVIGSALAFLLAGKTLVGTRDAAVELAPSLASPSCEHASCTSDIALQEGLFTHPTLAEGLNSLFATLDEQEHQSHAGSN